MRGAVPLIAVVMLAGCVQTVTTPDGRMGFAVSCYTADCYRTASEKCPNGYDVIEDRPAVAGTPTATVTYRDFVFACKTA